MKAYKLEIFVIDMDDLGGDEIKSVLENQKYPNYCITPRVMNMQEADIGEWRDDHPLNRRDKMREEYENLFKP